MLGCDSPSQPPGGNPNDSLPVVASVSIEPQATTLTAIGATVTLSATVLDSAGAPLAVPVSWSASGAGAVLVDTVGKVRAIANGIDTVAATAGSVTGTATIHVSQVVKSVTISVDAFALVPRGATLTLPLSAVDSLGHIVADAEVTWSSTHPGVLTVNAVTLIVTSEPAGSFSITGRRFDCTDGFALMYPCSNVDLMSFLSVSALGDPPSVSGGKINEIWGWTDPATGNDYALVGKTDGVTFVDVSDPMNPVVVGDLPKFASAAPSVHRDIKVYNNHAFVVADDIQYHGVQIFDLTQLRGVADPPETFVPTVLYHGVESAHNAIINEETGFLYIVIAHDGTNALCGNGLYMVDVNDPTNPTFVGCFTDGQTGRSGTGTVHDAQCTIYRGPDADYNGREVCFCSNETAFSLVDVSDKNNPTSIAIATYPNVGYAHSGWLTKDHRYFIMNDELDELAGFVSRMRLLVWDVSDLDNPVMVREYFHSSSATDHRHYIIGDTLYLSAYQAGFRIFDVTAPLNPVEVGYFDTVPEGGNPAGFGGSWGNFPFFSSGTIVVSSEEDGLFVLQRSQ
jgi:choice-of-anchor B domain-containing protein